MTADGLAFVTSPSRITAYLGHVREKTLSEGVTSQSEVPPRAMPELIYCVICKKTLCGVAADPEVVARPRIWPVRGFVAPASWHSPPELVLA